MRMGIDAVHAQLLPDDKGAHHRRFASRGAVVPMVGDGINDAPSLVATDVEFAGCSTGADIGDGSGWHHAHAR